MFVSGGARGHRELTCRDHSGRARTSGSPLSKDAFNGRLELTHLAIKVYAQRSCAITAGSWKLTIQPVVVNQCDGRRGRIGTRTLLGYLGTVHIYPSLHARPHIFSIRMSSQLMR